MGNFVEQCLYVIGISQGPGAGPLCGPSTGWPNQSKINKSDVAIMMVIIHEYILCTPHYEK